MQAHLDTEAYLRRCAAESGGAFSFTAIREGLYSESFPIYTGFFDPADAAQTEIRIPHDGTQPGVAWVKRDELGEASARLIKAYAEEPRSFIYLNEVVLLTGTRIWTLEETVRVLAEAAGREITLKPVSVEEYVKSPRNQEKFGGDDEKVRTWATAFDGIRSGECAVVSPTLREVLRREPEAFDVTIKKGGQFQNHG